MNNIETLESRRLLTTSFNPTTGLAVTVQEASDLMPPIVAGPEHGDLTSCTVFHDVQTSTGQGAAGNALMRTRRFAWQNGLRVSGNYEKYVELDREYPIWFVNASHPLAFRARTFSFPIVGSFPGLVFVQLGSLVDPAGITPKLEMFVKRRLPWVTPLDLPQFEAMPS